MDDTFRQRIVQLADRLYLADRGQTTVRRDMARVFRSYHAANCALEYHEHRSNKKWHRALILKP